MAVHLGDWKATATHHTSWEDAQGILTGTVLTALAISIFAQLGFLTGGTAGLAFIIHYATDWSFGAVFFAINLPSYVLAIRKMGWLFTGKTFVAIAVLSAMTELQPRLFSFQHIDPLYEAILGGLLLGFGLLALFRHRANSAVWEFWRSTCRTVSAGAPGWSNSRSTSPS